MEDNNKSFKDFLEDFETETTTLKEFIDGPNDNIRKLEASLTKTKTYFPFSKNIHTEPLPSEKSGEVRFFLSWEPCSLQKAFRLFFIEKEYLSETKEELIVFRKPFLECKLEIRHYWYQHLIPFMNSFKKKLEEYRLSLNKD